MRNDTLVHTHSFTAPAFWRKAAAWLQTPQMERTEHYRHELKYRISYAEKAALEVRMQPLLQRDAHAGPGGYMIRSLYFDDYWNAAYTEKNAGVLLRKKYRIRIYDCSDRVIKLERKKKYDNYICKEDATLTRSELEQILAGEYSFLLHSPQPLCREFYYECVSKMLRPRVIVDYDREPWVLDAGTVRITFDQRIRAAIGGFALFNAALPTLPVLGPDELVMEVKFTEFLPQFVRTVLPPKAQELTAISKYVLCCEKTAYLHGFAYGDEPGKE